MVPVCLRLPEETYLYLRRLARREAILRDASVTLQDLIRDAVEETYPKPPENLANERMAV